MTRGKARARILRNLVRPLIRLAVFASILFGNAYPASGDDAVIVTATLDRNSIGVGEKTTLRVWGQIAPLIESGSSRIFSWDIDGLNPAPSVAAPAWDQLLMPASDNPTGGTSSSSRGTTVGSNRIGIRNTFLTKAAAGKGERVELFEVEVTGVATGTATFSVRAGTGTPSFSYDFQVARAGGGLPFTGGNYASAQVALTVTAGLATIQSWRQTWYGTTSNTGIAADTADPYHTGIGNLAVFAFFGPNQDPAKARLSQLPQRQYTGGNFVYSFIQPAGVSGITYGAEWSSTMAPGSWLPIIDTGNGNLHTFSLPATSNARIFTRLKVTSP